MQKLNCIYFSYGNQAYKIELIITGPIQIVHWQPVCVFAYLFIVRKNEIYKHSIQELQYYQ